MGFVIFSFEGGDWDAILRLWLCTILDANFGSWEGWFVSVKEQDVKEVEK